MLRRVGSEGWSSIVEGERISIFRQALSAVFRGSKGWLVDCWVIMRRGRDWFSWDSVRRLRNFIQTGGVGENARERSLADRIWISTSTSGKLIPPSARGRVAVRVGG